MRIRKHASKILGTASSLPPPQSPSALLAEVSSSGCICVLNQSPWDVFPSSPPHNPQGGGWMGERITGEQPIFAVTSTTGGQVPGDVEEEQCKSNLTLTTQKSKKAKRKRVTVKKESGYDSTSRAAAPTYPCKKTDTSRDTSRDAAPTYPCKKTDGKQWQCRRPAHKPNSLCDYHLAQIKSYSYKALSVAQSASVHKRIQEKRIARSPATSAVSEIYYYSPFGPWRGKQRGGGDSGQHRSKVATANVESDREEKSRDYIDVTDEEESSEGSELEEKQKMSDTDREMGSKKKRRKPVKARSLKSLM